MSTVSSLSVNARQTFAWATVRLRRVTGTVTTPEVQPGPRSPEVTIRPSANALIAIRGPTRTFIEKRMAVVARGNVSSCRQMLAPRCVTASFGWIVTGCVGTVARVTTAGEPDKVMAGNAATLSGLALVILKSDEKYGAF